MRLGELLRAKVKVDDNRHRSCNNQRCRCFLAQVFRGVCFVWAVQFVRAQWILLATSTQPSRDTTSLVLAFVQRRGQRRPSLCSCKLHIYGVRVAEDRGFIGVHSLLCGWHPESLFTDIVHHRLICAKCLRYVLVEDGI